MRSNQNKKHPKEKEVLANMVVSVISTTTSLSSYRSDQRGGLLFLSSGDGLMQASPVKVAIVVHKETIQSPVPLHDHIQNITTTKR